MNKSTIVGIVVVAVILVVVLLVFSGRGKDNGGIETTGGDVREIAVDAQRFEFSPSVINVNQGETVRLNINNLDTTHGVRIPELGVSGNDVVEFTASEKGTYTFYCNTFCGEGHSAMSGTIVVS